MGTAMNQEASAADRVAPLFDRPLVDALPVEHLFDLSIDLEIGR